MKKLSLSKTLLTGAVVALMAVGLTSCKKDSDPDRDKFIGSYKVTNTCVTGTDWTSTIMASSAVEENILLNNLGGVSGLEATGTVSGSTVTIASQVDIDSDGDSWTISGSGTINGNIMTATISYSMTGGTPFSCAETWTKQ